MFVIVATKCLLCCVVALDCFVLRAQIAALARVAPAAGAAALVCVCAHSTPANPRLVGIISNSLHSATLACWLCPLLCMAIRSHMHPIVLLHQTRAVLQPNGVCCWLGWHRQKICKHDCCFVIGLRESMLVLVNTKEVRESRRGRLQSASAAARHFSDVQYSKTQYTTPEAERSLMSSNTGVCACVLVLYCTLSLPFCRLVVKLP